MALAHSCPKLKARTQHVHVCKCMYDSAYISIHTSVYLSFCLYLYAYTHV